MSVPRVSITRDAQGLHEVVDPQDKMLDRVGNALMRMLQHEYGPAASLTNAEEMKELMKIRNPELAHLSARDAVAALHAELVLYAKKRDPFDRQFKSTDTPLRWWKAVRKDESAKVLGVLATKLFSVVPNSMADERTMSQVDYLHTARRNRADLTSLKDQIQIRQWHKYKTSEPSPSLGLTVKWRDMKATIMEKSRVFELRSDKPSDSEHEHVRRELDPAPEDEGSDDGQSADDELDGDTAMRDSDSELIAESARHRRRRVRSKYPTDRFVVGDGINLGSPFLHELLDDGTGESVGQTKAPGARKSGQKGKDKDHSVLSAPAEPVSPVKFQWKRQ
ncbi:hypothetical protein PUNSTDRAFT_133774 [Punctularia strigosozonata HHB-11173 SS5]|uniref:uncharacterized protein n=1 Tax=Punctularia strigosozonata (strain HHB-11173) TaxID=741275 RepID=UPI0004416A1F|nr:uncharacterized protein PUNSTDRAFT_133774 [Punctularia strigosozonata HHB-11173 SS5]EIN10004.1 hypothetical protein PUNSTDRAFT_133774 [Punctularia strigosozonata HHB-11173 SS5]